jgi:hypothetical protein
MEQHVYALLFSKAEDPVIGLKDVSTQRSDDTKGNFLKLFFIRL